MKIDQLPVEMLLKIFSYLPSYDEVTLTNKQFYTIACTMNDLNKHLKINNLTCSEWLQSIRISKRRISKLRIADLLPRCPKLDQQVINSVIENFSATIRSLKYEYADMDESAFLTILTAIPNAEHLALRSIRDNRKSSSSAVCTDNLNLTKLKSLAISGVDFFSVFDRLPVGVLTELEVDRYNWEALIVMISRQHNIKTLTLSHLDLKGSTISRVTIATILSKLPKLKSLTLPHKYRLITTCSIDTHIMDAVADLKELEVLGMDVSDTPEASFVNIRKLKNLKHLSLRLSWFDVSCKAKLKIVAQSNNASLITLTIGGIFEMTAGLFRVLAKSAPNLKRIEFLAGYCFERADDVDEILTHFNFVEDLTIITDFRAASVGQGNYFNPMLRKLGFTCGHIYEPWLTKFIAAYPNLTQLTLYISPLSPYKVEYTVQVRSILTGFTKLESLIIHGQQNLNVDVEDFDYLCEHKINLKFLSIDRLNKNTLTDDLLKKLRTNYEVVIVDIFSPCLTRRYDRILNLAVDRPTMQCQREKPPRFERLNY